MASQDIFKNMQNNLFEEFKSQDVENGYFDVCFKIEEKLLHAHKVILAAVSKPFGVMFAERWTKKSEPIELTQYSYDNYKELMTFIYSGACELKDDNVFNLLDMAECYDVADFKSFCDTHLSKKAFSVEKVFQYIELVHRYSLVELDEALKKFFSSNFWTLVQSENFMKCNKSIIEAFVDYVGELDGGYNEYCFTKVLEWAQKRVETKMNESNDENFDLQKATKNELSGILSKFKFSKMRLQFLIEDVAKHSYLFSGEELSNHLSSSRKIIITASNSPGITLTGQIPYDQEIINILDPLTHSYRCSTNYTDFDCWKSMQRRIPEKPRSLKKNDTVPFYLVIREVVGKLKRNMWGTPSSKYVCLVPFRHLEDTDYLIAEMNGDNDFHLSGRCFLKYTTNY